VKSRTVLILRSMRWILMRLDGRGPGEENERKKILEQLELELESEGELDGEAESKG
jgi:hypothetical protein